MTRLKLIVVAFALSAPCALAQDPQAPHGPEVPADLKLYSEASLRMHRQDHDQAYRLLGRLLAEHPDSRMRVPALFWRGQCLEELNRPAEAKRVYELLVRDHAESGWAADAHRRLAALAAQRPLEARLATGPRTLVLANGDRLSGRVVGSEGDRVIIEADGVGKLTMPRGRIAGVHVLNVDDGDSKTVVNEDGSKTTTTIAPDGTKTVTTIRETKDGKRVVEVQRTKTVEGGDSEDQIELRFDGDEDLEGLEGLKDLPKKLRLRIEKSLEGLRGKDGVKKQLRFRLFGDDEDEVRRFGGDELEKRVEVFKDQAKSWREAGKGWKDYAQGWKDYAEGFARDPERHIYRLGPDGQEHMVWLDDGAGLFGGGGGGTQDRVHLRNGDKISGTLLEVDEEHVKMKTGYGMVEIDRDQVRQITFGNKPKPFLGLVGGGAAEGGVRVAGVQEDSAAAKAGLKEGDVITSVGDHPVRSLEEVGKRIRSHKVGDVVSLTVRRGERQLELRATLGEYPRRSSFGLPRPPAPPRGLAPRLRERIEKRLERKDSDTPRDRRAPLAPPAAGQRPFLGISCGPHERGVAIEEIMDGSALEGAAKPGDVITHFKGVKVESVEQLIEGVRATRPGQKVGIRIERGEGQALELEVPMGGRPASGPRQPEAPEPPKPPTRPQLRQY